MLVVALHQRLVEVVRQCLRRLMPGKGVLLLIVHLREQKLPDLGIHVFGELAERVEKLVLEENRVSAGGIGVDEGVDSGEGGEALELEDGLVAEADGLRGVDEGVVEGGVHEC